MTAAHSSVADEFLAMSGHQPDGIWSSPGRVNLIGEHTDYNDGFALPFAIAARVYVAAGRRDDRLLRVRSQQLPGADVEVPLDELAPGHPRGWAGHAAGVVWATQKAGRAVGGMDLVVDGRVPQGSGLSSSHALQCAVAGAIDGLYGLELSRDEMARLSLVTENEFVGAPTGMMDQLASLLCVRGHALFIDNRSLAVEHVPLVPEPDALQLLVVDTRVQHEHAAGEYGARRASCERATGLLGLRALRDLPSTDLDAALARLPDDELRRRVRHVVLENDRVLSAVTALRARDWERLGVLMNASHDSLRDDYEVSCAELDTAVTAARDAGALGARMTGGGFGGSAVALVPAGVLESVRAAVTTAFATKGWREPGIDVVRPSDGMRRDA